MVSQSYFLRARILPLVWKSAASFQSLSKLPTNVAHYKETSGGLNLVPLIFLAVSPDMSLLGPTSASRLFTVYLFSELRARVNTVQSGLFCRLPRVAKAYFKGSVSTAFVVWKYFSCVKEHLILCFAETKMGLKPLIMLFSPVSFLLLSVMICAAVIARPNCWEEKWFNSAHVIQTLRMYYSCWPISWLIPDRKNHVIYVLKSSNN